MLPESSLIPKSSDAVRVLLVRARGSVYALSLETVIETMRPLPAELIPGMPPYLRGLAVVRGEAVPVVDLAVLLDGPKTDRVGRFILVRAGRRKVVIAVEAVLGVFGLDRSIQQGLPPLLQDANAELMASVGVRDQQLLLLLQPARLVPEEAWREFESRGEKT